MVRQREKGLRGQGVGVDVVLDGASDSVEGSGCGGRGQGISVEAGWMVQSEAGGFQGQGQGEGEVRWSSLSRTAFFLSCHQVLRRSISCLPMISRLVLVHASRVTKQSELDLTQADILISTMLGVKRSKNLYLNVAPRLGTGF